MKLITPRYQYYVTLLEYLYILLEELHYIIGIPLLHYLNYITEC